MPPFYACKWIKILWNRCLSWSKHAIIVNKNKTSKICIFLNPYNNINQ